MLMQVVFFYKTFVFPAEVRLELLYALNDLTSQKSLSKKFYYTKKHKKLSL